jgi:hypothetical protein
MALFHCCLKSDVEGARLLLAAGHCVTSTLYGDSPLHMASTRSREMVVLLLTYGSPVNARDMAGDTPLGLALSSGSVDIVRTLLWAGADVNMMNYRGVNVLEFGMHRVDLAALVVPLAARDRLVSVFHFGVFETDVLDLLLQHVDVDCMLGGLTRLAKSVWNQRFAEADRLLRRGAKLTKGLPALNGRHLLQYLVDRLDQPTLVWAILRVEEKGVFAVDEVRGIRNIRRAIRTMVVADLMLNRVRTFDDGVMSEIRGFLGLPNGGYRGRWNQLKLILE